MNALQKSNTSFFWTWLTVVAISLGQHSEISAQEEFEFRGRIIDAGNQATIFSRVYLENEKGDLFTVESAAPDGTAIPYRVERGNSKEVHTTISNHVFKTSLTPGKYKLTAEHGKEYLPATIEFEIKDHAVQKTVSLTRWSNVAAENWYSGEVHIHRKVEEMPTVIQAEDLNVVLPLTYWVTDTESIPVKDNKANDKSYTAKLLEITPQYVIWPINTEYEIFSVKKKQHTLGAFFILGHQNPLQLKTPPVGPVVQQARSEGALIDLDKHNWPWSMMIIPQMKVDLFELTNNHIWRTSFLFKDWYKEYAADFMRLELDKDGGFTAKGWLDFGLQNYYALLNCGIRISPSGGTASGVHPVPAGFGRVYVHLPNGFSYDQWMTGLKKGNSFVTNGPMLQATVNGKVPGNEFEIQQDKKFRVEVTASFPLDRKSSLEIILNGDVLAADKVQISKQKNGVLILTTDQELEINRSSWLCVRCTQRQENGNISFAHTAPFYFKNGSQPIQPKRAEVEYLLKRVEDELNRNKTVLTPAQLKDYESARAFYENKLKIAK